MRKIAIVYIPVLHQGYVGFLESTQADEVWILGDWLAQEFREIAKDVRRLQAAEVRTVVESLKVGQLIKVVSKKEIRALNKQKSKVVLTMPDDQIMHTVAEKYLPQLKVDFAPVFLRWDKHKALAKVIAKPDEVISKKAFDRKMMKLALGQAAQSVDWWRQAGGVLVKNSKVLLLGYNQHLPTEYESYFHNDIRSLFAKGSCLELIVSIHSEAQLIAAAAKQGISTEGTDLYTSLFPCPLCAKQIAQAGIRRVYYLAGYTLVDGEQILKSARVELIRVELSSTEVKKLQPLLTQRSIIKQYEK